jgi:unsaturated rhamnogalacturonyl hydrolase
VTSITQLQTLAVKTAELLLPYPWKFWFWGDSIGFDGLLDASELTQQGKYLTFAYGALKAWIARERCRSEFDYTAPGVALLRVYEKTGDPALLSAARRHGDYMAAFRQTESGAYVRYEDAAIELPPELPANHPDLQATKALANQVTNGGPCIFVDSMHFDGPFFAKLYQITGEEHYRRLSLANILSQIELLYDPKDGLFHHFWIEQTKSRNGIAWGRGNGWGLLGLVDTLAHLPAEDAGAIEVREVLKKVLARMAELQAAGGGWHTVLNDRSSYIETSIAAFMVSAMSRALLHSWIEPKVFGPVVEAALAFLLKQVRPDGLLEGVSYETFPSTRVEHYRRMPRGGVVPWGQGALLAALWGYAQLRSASKLDAKHLQGG